jgi:hypothetical protein
VEAAAPAALTCLSEQHVSLSPPAQSGEVEMKQGEALIHVSRHWIIAAQQQTKGFIYRSVLVEDDDTEYLAVKQRFEGYIVTGTQVIEDDQMMFGHGELTLYGKV